MHTIMFVSDTCHYCDVDGASHRRCFPISVGIITAKCDGESIILQSECNRTTVKSAMIDPESFNWPKSLMRPIFEPILIIVNR